MTDDLTPVVRRYVDALQINLFQIQHAAQTYPRAEEFLGREYSKCMEWLERYNEVRTEVFGG